LIAEHFQGNKVERVTEMQIWIDVSVFRRHATPQSDFSIFYEFSQLTFEVPAPNALSFKD
jgi:hypothetical protein